MTTAHLKCLAEANEVSEYGAKAANLARLQQLGHRVPSAVVIAASAYQDHLKRAGIAQSCAQLLSSLHTVEPAQLRLHGQRFREAILATPLDPRLLAALLQNTAAQGLAWPLIVRSSAASEDAQGASFAGQLDSVTQVDSPDALAQALLTVWCSPWSDRCLAYAQRKGGFSGALGVIVQQQVDALFSGVLFTRDPTVPYATNHMLLEYVEGLGESLAQGAVTPSSVRIDSAHGVPQEHRHEIGAATLSEAALQSLAKTGRLVEQQMGAPQDIEWCIDRQGCPILVQTRPITAVAAPAAVETWSNANIAENFPDPVPPLVFFIVSRGYTAYFRNLGLSLGLAPQRVAAMRAQLEKIVGLHAARLYYNLSNIHAALNLMPFGARLAASFNQFTGAQESPSVAAAPATVLSRLIGCCRIVACVIGQYAFIKQRIAAFEQQADHFASRTEPSILATQSLEECIGHFRDFLAIRFKRWNNAALADAAAMVCYGVLQHLFRIHSAAAQSAGIKANDLLKGLPGLASTQPVVALWQLSRQIREDAPLRVWFLSATLDELLADQKNSPFPDFRAAFDRYLQQWGFRYSRELTLTAPTPQEDPRPLLRMLRSYVEDDGEGPQFLSATQQQQRIVHTRALSEALTPNRWLRGWALSKAGQFRLILSAAQGAIMLRERARMKQALLYTRLRHVLLRLGDEFASLGWVATREQIFFMTPEEICQLADHRQMPPEFTQELAQRQQAFDAAARLTPPDSFTLPSGASWDDHALPERAREAQPGDTLNGASACGGQIQARAAVILDVADADKLHPGEILVTRQTDPGWATVFFMVKGLVIERGGMLSHGAIIAREYGIPAVIGVPSATQRIRHGQHILVDGDQGVVRLLDG